MEKKHGDHTESFGIRHNVGDIVGCFLDADLNRISKKGLRKIVNHM